MFSGSAGDAIDWAMIEAKQIRGEVEGNHVPFECALAKAFLAGFASGEGGRIQIDAARALHEISTKGNISHPDVWREMIKIATGK